FKVAEELAKPLRESGIEVSVTVAWGNPPISEVIKRTRESKPALVIKAVSHHARLSNLILGNDDWEAIRYCEAPLLLVKSGKWEDRPNFIASVDPAHVHDKPASLDNKIIACANSLASAFEGGLYAFHSAWMPPLSGMYPVTTDARVEEATLAEFARSHDIDAAQCLWSDENITESLPKLCQALSASAVVMGAVSRSRLDRILIGNTAEKLIDKLDCDILVVKPDEMPELNKILI
ncbi:MAG: universal stress protein, partial [Gammaproteobacteria bacterium]